MKKVTNISISICYESEAVKEGCSFLKSVRRSVLVNGIKTYEDEMSPDMFVSCQDPIRKLEEFLVGVERGKTDENLKRHIRLIKIMNKITKQILWIIAAVILLGVVGKCDHDEQVIYNMPDDVYQALKKELGNPSDGQLVDEYIRNRAHWDSIGNSFEY